MGPQPDSGKRANKKSMSYSIKTKNEKYIRFLKQRGIIKFIYFTLRRSFFFFYKYCFKKCEKIFIAGSFQITGKENIEIGSFSAGSRIRIDAIKIFEKQTFKPKIIIANNVVVNNDFHLACTGSIYIGNNVLIGSNVFITDHDHGIYSADISEASSPHVRPALRKLTANGYVNIGDNVFIGEYVSILKNVTIGQGAVLGAHSLVTKSIPDYSLAVGNPAKVIKYYNFKTNRWESCK